MNKFFLFFLFSIFLFAQYLKFPYTIDLKSESDSLPKVLNELKKFSVKKIIVIPKNDILTFLKEKKHFLQQQYGGLSIGLFGSYARDEYTSESDIDIAVELKKENKADNYFGLLHFLEDNLHKKIDLGIESNLKKIVKEYVDKEIIHV